MAVPQAGPATPGAGPDSAAQDGDGPHSAAPDGAGKDGAGKDGAGRQRGVPEELFRPDATRAGTVHPDAVRPAPTRPDATRPDARAVGVQAMVERQIRQAQERGLFDNLPGAGRPLRHLGGPRDENCWLRQYLLRQGVSGAAFLPPALALRKEAEDLPERVRVMSTEAQVRAAVGNLNERILEALRKPAEGPQMTLMQMDVEAIVFGWRISRISHGARSVGVPPAPTADLAAESRGGRFRRRRSR